MQKRKPLMLAHQEQRNWSAVQIYDLANSAHAIAVQEHELEKRRVIGNSEPLAAKKNH